MSPLKRRTFLTGLSAGAAAGMMSGCQRIAVQYAVPLLNQPEELVPGVEVAYASTCTACPAACGVLVTVRDGRPVKMEGHPEHPASAGGLCAIGQADVRGLYHADRPKRPALDGHDSTWEQVDKAVLERLEAAKSEGKGVALLTPTITSFSFRRDIQAFVKAHDATWVEYDPDVDAMSAALAAWQEVSGRALLPDLRIHEADVLVLFGADLLATGHDPVTHSQRYGARRRDHKKRGAMRHIQIEGAFSLTGGAADERWQAAAAEERLIALWLLKNVAGKVEGKKATSVLATLANLPGLPSDSARVETLARELIAAGKGKSLVWTGSDDPAQQLAVATINVLLDNVGETLDLENPSLVRRSRDSALAELRKAMSRGELGALFVWGLDPVRQLPDGAALAKEIEHLRLSVVLADRPSDTATLSKVVAATHHGLEQWGDYMPRTDVLSMAQPTVQPLLETRHPMMSLLKWSGADEVESYAAHQRAAWEETVYPDAVMDEFGALWHRSLATGLATTEHIRREGFEKAVVVDADDLGRLLARSLEETPFASPDSAYEVALVCEVGRRGGNHAHIELLCELPEPLTHTSWVATVRVAPKAAKSLGVEDGDLLAITVGSAKLTLPVRITPGQHPRVLGVPVGYAKNNGWTLMQWDKADRLRRRGLFAQVSKAGEGQGLPESQRHFSAEGRPIIHQVARYDEKVPEPHHASGNLWRQRPTHSPSWEMVIDLDACFGCSACVVACQVENNIPVVGEDEIRAHRTMHWLRMDRYFDGDVDDPDVLFEPMMCQQCDHAPCETVCPVLATMHSSDGLNQQVYNRCVGTRYCANNCPYKVRRFNWFDYDFGKPLERMALNPEVVVRERGIMEKCTFCVQRIQTARIAARKRGVPEPETVTTACQQSCPTQAISFGDGSKPEGAIAQLKREPRTFQVLAELGVRPSIYYLAQVRTRRGDS